MAETKELEIDWKGQKAKIVIKRLGYGEMNKFKEEFTTTTLDEMDIPHVEVHPFLMRTLALQYCIVEAPFGKDIGTLNGLDQKLGEFLYGEIEQFNQLNVKKNVTSSEQSTQDSSETPK